MYDLGIILPLYGNDCAVVSDKMVKSLFYQKIENHKVKYVFFYDKTVQSEAIVNIINNELISRNPNISIELHYTGEHTASGYKRNIGIQRCSDCKYMWLVDQDDFIIYNDAVEKLLDCIEERPDEPVFKLTFSIPEQVAKMPNGKAIFGIPTMPWQYVFKYDEVKNYRFAENCEYGSDIPVTIYFLVDHGYYKIENEQGSMSYGKNSLSTVKIPIYFYNYLNPNSCLGQNNLELNNMAKEIAYPLFRKKLEEQNEVQK